MLLMMLLTTTSAWAQSFQYSFKVHVETLDGASGTVSVSYTNASGTSVTQDIASGETNSFITSSSNQGFTLTMTPAAGCEIAQFYYGKNNTSLLNAIENNNGIYTYSGNSSNIGSTYTIKFGPNSNYYFVHFDPGLGGTGTMADQTFVAGQSQALTANAFSCEGYVFVGWNIKADGSGTSYTNGQSVTISGNVTLYAQWAKGYLVHFVGQGGTGAMADQVFKLNEAQNLTANAFSYNNYPFLGWTTTPNANAKVAYTDGQSVTNLTTTEGATVTLYAKWQGINQYDQFHVRFDANGGSGTMDIQSIIINTTAPLSANTFTRDGYKFIGWSTTPDGSVAYLDRQEVTNLGGGVVTLYARWSNNYYTVHFDKNNNDATGTMEDQFIPVDETVPLKPCTFEYTNYGIYEWTTKADGSGASCADGASVTNLAAAGKTVTLYANWRAGYYKIHFDANGGMGTMANQPVTQSDSQYLNANAFTREGYTFIGWSIKAPDGNVNYTDGQNYNDPYRQPGQTVRFYAQWQEATDPENYAVHFNANGGSGTMYDQGIAADGSADLKTCTFTREGYKFTGWSTTVNGTIVYLDGENVSGLASAGQTVNLYAQWNKGAMTIAKEQGGIVVTLDGDSNESFAVTNNIQTSKVILRRKFVAGVPTTICLPFDFSRSNFDHEDFSTLNYVDENQETHQLVAHMTVVSELHANTPYYFEPTETTATPANQDYTEITFTNVTIEAGNAGSSSTTGGWTIVGNYDRVKWTTNTADELYNSTHAAELGRAYGYAKKTKTVGGVTYQEGQFVKLGNGAHTRAFRAYMLAPATTDSPNLLPDAIDVVWHNEDGTTGVNEVKEVKEVNDNSWYTLSGTRLDKQPTQKGLYIHGGSKVVVK